jgi:hypothetical protein
MRKLCLVRAVSTLMLSAALMAGALMLPAPAYARDHFHGGHGFGFGVGLGLALGADAFWGWPGYYYPYGYPYGPYPYAAPVASEVTVIQPAAAAAAPQFWYYCDNPSGYYPYIPSCPTAWRPVPATPAAAPQGYAR